MQAERKERLLGRLLLHPFAVVSLVLIVTLASAGPALATASVSRSSTTLTHEQRIERLLISLASASSSEAPVLQEEPVVLDDGAGPESRALPVIPAAIAGAIAICATGAIGTVGLETLNRLIAEGNVGTARQLLADAITGCVAGAGLGLALKACRAFSPCKRALNSAVSRAVDALLKTLD